jgi:hypothetical protein
VARPPGGIDLARLYEENLIDGVVFDQPWNVTSKPSSAEGGTK